MITQPNQELIIKTFALQNLNTKIYRGKIPPSSKDESPITTRKSSLGTPIFSDLQFQTIVPLGGHIPIDTALFTVNQDKNIIVTNIQGRDGSIKEYIGESDYRINIKGVICGINGAYPWEDVQSLLRYLRYGQSIGITSQFLNKAFNIDEIVVTGFEVPQAEGGQSFQRFEINCLSEKPVEILISEAQV